MVFILNCPIFDILNLFTQTLHVDEYQNINSGSLAARLTELIDYILLPREPLMSQLTSARCFQIVKNFRDLPTNGSGSAIIQRYILVLAALNDLKIQLW